MDRPSVIPQLPSPPPSRFSDSNKLSKTTISRLNSRNIEALPDELLFDILVCLPADFLHHTARLVCRRWRRIILSDAFTNTHIQHHTTYGLVLSSRLRDMDPHSYYVTATKGSQTETSVLRNIRRNRSIIATSCNGLILQVHDGNANDNTVSLHVINPTTMQSFRLPSVSVCNRRVYEKKCRIAYCAASMQYKVILPLYSVEDGQIQYWLDIFTVGVDKSWRRAEIPPGFGSSIFLHNYPVISEGFMHWGSEGYCLTLNVETEIITRTEAPIPLDHHVYWYYYLSTGRYLTLLACSRLNELSWEVWEMKPAESGEWRKAVLPNIDLEDKKCRFAYGDDYICLFPVGWVNYPEVLAFYYRAGCISYNLETHEINTIDLPLRVDFNNAFVHRNSLAWLRLE